MANRSKKIYSEKEIHRQIWEACDRTYKRMYSVGAHTPPETEAVTAHQSLWYKLYGGQILIAAIAYLLALVGGIMLIQGTNLEKDWILFLILALTSVAGIHCLVGHNRNKRNATFEELSLLEPALRLNTYESLYFSTLKSAHGNSTLSDVEFEQIRNALNGLLDEATKTLEQKAILEKTSSSQTPTNLKQQIADTRAQLAVTEDAFTQRALETTLHLLLERTSSQAEYQPQLQRFEAQLGVIKQAFLTLQESLIRLEIGTSNSIVDNVDSVMNLLKRSSEPVVSIYRAKEELEEKLQTLN